LNVTQLLNDCAEKLKLYRAAHSEEYLGGVEYTELQKQIAAMLDHGVHCSTCQCANVHEGKHVPGNSMSRSWHKSAPNGPPK
jgi:hypothetical protein